MDETANAKAALRKESLARRDALSADDRIEGSLSAAEHATTIEALANITPGTIIAGSNPIRSEIDPRPLMASLAASGARLCLPVVINKTTIEFRELIRGAPLIETGFGTFGPDESASVLDPEILLVPLSVYDCHGGRIGYGAGFYDRAIEKLTHKTIEPKLFGMAYTTQEAKTVPMEAHDRYLDAIITESGVNVPEGKST